MVNKILIALSEAKPPMTNPSTHLMCNLYSITINQEAIIRLFCQVNRYVGDLAPMPDVFPDYSAPVVRNTPGGGQLMAMRWGMP
jgi:putative SOS response-associated peptidase YedK